VDIPLLGIQQMKQDAGAAAGMSGRVIFAACWAGDAHKSFRKNSDSPRLSFFHIFQEVIQMDMVYLLLTVLFFVVTACLIGGCDRLRRQS